MAGSIAFVTPTSAPAWQRWLVFSPVARIVIFTALAFGIGYGVHDLVAHLGWTAKGASALQHALAQVSIEVIASAGAYLILVRGVERRRVAELSPRAILTYGLRGLIGGVVLFSVIVGLLWLFGCYHVHGINAHVDWLPPLLVAGISAGIGEEIITRGVLFRIVEEGLGTWWALAISALFFGAAHVFNPNATKPGLSNRLWEVEGPCAAVANGYFVLQPNRVGREDNEYGELAVDFYGTSQVIDPRGNFVGERGSGEHEEILIRDLDLDMVQQMRDDWQFYRDRRPESYTSIPKP